MKRVVSAGIISVVFAGALSVPTTSTAVTFGSEVAAPSGSSPWAVAIYQNSDGDLSPGASDFVCSGTALDVHTVLTAAHCVEDGGFLLIGYGADRLADQVLEPVQAIIDHPAYGSQQIVNDVAVLRTLDPMDISTFPALATSGQAGKARKPSAKLRIYGWGDNQNSVLTGRLGTALLKPQAQAARLWFGPAFSRSKNLAAGKYHSSTHTYSGGCYGDSGGPLVMTVKGQPVVVGVTSYVAKGCLAKAPTVFASLGNYRSWILGAIAGLPAEAQLENTAFPYNYVDGDPNVTGTVALGQSLTCNPGSWTANVNKFAFRWAWADGSVVDEDETYLVEEADLGETVTCTVRAYSDAGYSEASADPVAMPVA